MPDRVCNFRPLLYLSPHNRHQRAPPSGGLASSWILVTFLPRLLFIVCSVKGDPVRCSTMFTTDYHYRPANQAIRRRTMSTVALTAAQSTRPSAVSLQADLRAAPVATLRVIPDLVVRAHANPLRDRPVLLQLLGQRLLDAESLVARHGAAQGNVHVRRLWRLDPKDFFGREGHVEHGSHATPPCPPPSPSPRAGMRDRHQEGWQRRAVWSNSGREGHVRHEAHTNRHANLFPHLPLAPCR